MKSINTYETFKCCKEAVSNNINKKEWKEKGGNKNIFYFIFKQKLVVVNIEIDF